MGLWLKFKPELDIICYIQLSVYLVGVRNRGGVSARCRRMFLYTTGFTFGSTAFASKCSLMLRDGNEVHVTVTKYLFEYLDDMLDAPHK
jgi:hypothetical protein